MRRLLVILAVWIVLTVAFAVPEYYLAAYLGRPMTWSRAFLGVVPHYVMWALLGIAIARGARRWPLKRPHLATRIALHLLLAFAFYGIDCLVSTVMLPAVVHDRHLTPYVLRMLFLRGFYDDFVLYWAIVGVVQLVDETNARARLQREFAVAQLSSLRSQIQPHFLFNTLNSIAELLHTDAAAAERMTESLAELLRGTLELGDGNEIALRDELQLLDLYLAIQEVRFSDSITIERSIDPAALAACVPPLLLQPLAENAFRHGLSRRRQQGRLAVVARREGDRLFLQVRDNGAGLPEDLREGVGLRNTRVRLEQLHGAGQSMQVAEAPGGGAQVTITLPYREGRA